MIAASIPGLALIDIWNRQALGNQGAMAAWLSPGPQTAVVCVAYPQKETDPQEHVSMFTDGFNLTSIFLSG